MLAAADISIDWRDSSASVLTNANMLCLTLSLLLGQLIPNFQMNYIQTTVANQMFAEHS